MNVRLFNFKNHLHQGIVLVANQYRVNALRDRCLDLLRPSYLVSLGKTACGEKSRNQATGYRLRYCVIHEVSNPVKPMKVAN